MDLTIQHGADYAPVIRYAEVLLSRAEALVRQGSSVTQGAVDLLNAVRVRSFPTGAYTLASFATAADFNTAVLQERNFEFLGEGLRAFDIMRLGLDIPLKDGGSNGDNCCYSRQHRLYVADSFTELSLNKLMTPLTNKLEKLKRAVSQEQPFFFSAFSEFCQTTLV